MTKLFISHASEDKDSFVRPLAVELKKDFDVWFDEFELKLGDSLRLKIDDGLCKCDFGIVVLSPAFFAKKWTVAEINGLFALEDANRKIILPIWHQVREKEVRDFSPMLADRRAVATSNGLDRVVEEIKIAIGASERTHEVLVSDGARRALTSMMERIHGWELNEKVFQAGAGDQMLETSACQIETMVWNKLKSVNLPDRPRFAKASQSAGFRIQGPFRVTLTIDYSVGHGQSGYRPRVSARVFLGRTDFEPGSSDLDLRERSWLATCTAPDKLGYKPVTAMTPDHEYFLTDASDAALSEQEVADQIVECLCGEVVKQVNNKQGAQ
jgi:hypothetical protein